ncbi:MAG: asparagine synthase (glutamine-hydrolyzing) [Bacteroidota bacterium]
MCGINGIFNFSNVIIANGESLLNEMNNCISHRGPDDSGLWKNDAEGIYFGHRRLSIIDLSAAGHQPMVSENGNVIIFNGEIYNYKEIKEYVKERKFKSNSDTEVLLYLYEKYGQDCLKLLNGMFAFAIWDSEKKELFLAKDRAGKKPIYYSSSNGIFAFSSEIKALLKLHWIKSELDEKAFYHFLTFNMLPPPLTMFKNIFKMYPAHYMVVNKDGVKTNEQYWEVDYKIISDEKSESLEEKLFERLQKSVNYRMVADVPAGAFLSGGVDSSAIVAMMSKTTSHPVKTYSIGFEGQPDFDELVYAQKVSKLFGTDHYEKIVSPDDMKNFLPKIVDIFDEPLADSTCIPIYFISQLAKEKNTVVVLTGDGSDEIFAGYRNYAKYLKYYPLFHSYSKMPAFLKKIIAKSYNAFDDSSPAAEMFHRAALSQEFFWGGARSFKESAKRNFLSKDFLVTSENYNSYEVILNYRKMFDNIPNHHKEDIDWMCYLGYKFTDTNRYLYRADRLGMANSIELRSPFMDYEFVNFALSVPGKLKIADGEPKYILKKTLEKILPKEILYRKKMGFNVPLKEWGNEVMTDYVETNLKSFCANTNLFNESGLRNLLTRIKKGNQKGTNDLFTVYFLMAWFKKWMSG